jgi:hypothetical protein
MDETPAKRTPRWVFLATAAAALVVEFQLFGFWLPFGIVLASAAVVALAIWQSWHIRQR